MPFHVMFWSVPSPGGQPEPKARLHANQLARFDPDGSLKDPAWPRSVEAAAPWLAYARNHLFLLDDRASLAILDAPANATLYEPSFYLPVARIRGPLNIPVLQERHFGELTEDEIRQFSRQARGVVGSAKPEHRLMAGTFTIPIFAPDGRTIASFLDGTGVVLNDVASGRPLRTYAPDKKWKVVDLAYTPDGRLLVLAGFHPRIHVWRLRPSQLVGHKKEVRGLAFSPDRTSLASAADDSTIKLWDIAEGHERATFEGYGSSATAVAYSPDGTLLASAGSDQTIRLWDAATRQQLVALPGHHDRVRALAFSPDGKTLASAGDDRTIRLWDVATRRDLVPPLTAHTDPVSSLAFGPNGTTLYSGSLDKTIRVWDPATGHSGAVWNAEDQVRSLAVAPDGQTLAVGHPNGNVTLWDVATQKTRPPMAGHVGDVLGLAFSPDGLTLASGGRDKTVRVWDPITAQELLTLNRHKSPVHAIAFSPDSTILATGSSDGAIKLWRALPDRAHQTAGSEKRHRPEPR